jgi:hypothetical protein
VTVNTHIFFLALVYESQLITVQHTSGHVKVSTVYFVVLFAIPVATFCRVDRGSEAEVNDGANVYPNGPKDVQADSNMAIWKAMVEH